MRCWRGKNGFSVNHTARVRKNVPCSINSNDPRYWGNVQAMNVKSKWKLRAKRQKTKQLHPLKWQKDHGIRNQPPAKIRQGNEWKREREREVFQTKTDNNHNRKNQWNEKVPFIFGNAFLCVFADGCGFRFVKYILFFFRSSFHSSSLSVSLNIMRFFLNESKKLFDFGN